MKYQKNMVNLKYLNIKIYNYIDIDINNGYINNASTC